MKTVIKTYSSKKPVQPIELKDDPFDVLRDAPKPSPSSPVSIFDTLLATSKSSPSPSVHSNKDDSLVALPDESLCQRLLQELSLSSVGSVERFNSEVELKKNEIRKSGDAYKLTTSSDDPGSQNAKKKKKKKKKKSNQKSSDQEKGTPYLKSENEFFSPSVESNTVLSSREENKENYQVDSTKRGKKKRRTKKKENEKGENEAKASSDEHCQIPIVVKPPTPSVNVPTKRLHQPTSGKNLLQPSAALKTAKRPSKKSSTGIVLDLSSSENELNTSTCTSMKDTSELNESEANQQNDFFFKNVTTRRRGRKKSIKDCNLVKHVLSKSLRTSVQSSSISENVSVTSFADSPNSSKTHSTKSLWSHQTESPSSVLSLSTDSMSDLSMKNSQTSLSSKRKKSSVLAMSTPNASVSSTSYSEVGASPSSYSADLETGESPSPSGLSNVSISSISGKSSQDTSNALNHIETSLRNISLSSSSSCSSPSSSNPDLKSLSSQSSTHSCRNKIQTIQKESGALNSIISTQESEQSCDVIENSVSGKSETEQICHTSTIHNSETLIAPKSKNNDDFKKPFVPMIPISKQQKKEPNFYVQMATIQEDTIIERYSNARFSLAAHSKLGTSNMNFSIMGDTAASNISINAPATANRFVLETGKLYRRSLLRARRESRKLNLSKVQNSSSLNFLHETTQFSCNALLNQTDYCTQNMDYLYKSHLCDTKVQDVSQRMLLNYTEIQDFSQKTLSDISKIQHEESFQEVPDEELPLDHLLQKISAKELTFERCHQDGPLNFCELYSDKILRQCKKLGEGVFGEVFLLGQTQNNGVIKIIPIEGDKIVNEEKQKKFHEVLSEIITAQVLSDLRHTESNNTVNFNQVLAVNIVCGRYPPILIQQWDIYAEKEKTYNDRPDMFDEEQLYVVLKLENAGKDLESFEFTSAYQSYSAFLQLAFALAVAETEVEFEHRDLHWGNLLIKPTKERLMPFVLDGVEYSIPMHGVQTTIIDFTLSRTTFKHELGKYVVYFNLGNDPELFMSEGDYQFDIYRMMKESNNDDWCTFNPRTNVFWLHYTVDKLVSECHYKKSKDWRHKRYLSLLKKIRENLLSCWSCRDFIKSFNETYGRPITDLSAPSDTK